MSERGRRSGLLALPKDDDRPSDRAERLLGGHDGKREVWFATFVELFLVAERVPFDRERSVTAILEPAASPGDPDVVDRASEHVDERPNTSDAVHAAFSGGLSVRATERTTHPTASSGIGSNRTRVRGRQFGRIGV